jgi:hypothetical protein
LNTSITVLRDFRKNIFTDYKLKLEEGKFIIVHVNRLKRAKVNSEMNRHIRGMESANVNKGGSVEESNSFIRILRIARMRYDQGRIELSSKRIGMSCVILCYKHQRIGV